MKRKLDNVSQDEERKEMNDYKHGTAKQERNQKNMDKTKRHTEFSKKHKH